MSNLKCKRVIYIFFLAFLYEIFYYPIILIFDKYDEQTYYIMIIDFKKKKKKPKQTNFIKWCDIVK